MAFGRYFLIDDTAVSASFGSGAGSGQPVSPEFYAATAADAQTVAGIFATTFNRTVRLVAVAGTPPWTPTFTPSTCRVIPSQAPNSITF